MDTDTTNHDELIITRTFDAPREKVWQAWANPDQFKQWWGPRNFTCSIEKHDFRIGGEYLHGMHTKDVAMWSTGKYQEIDEPNRLVMTDSFADKGGKVVPASHYGFKTDFPLEMQIEVTFEESDGKTKLIIRHIGMPANEHEDASGGWNQSLDKLGELLSTD